MTKKEQSSKQKIKKHNKEDKLQTELDVLTAELQRLQADFVNFRNRAEKDQVNAKATGKANVIIDLLPVLDNLDRAIAYQPEDLKDHDWTKGVASVSKQLTTKLNELGLEKIKTIGEEFNPDLMEAVSAEGDGSKELVSEELRGGYIMNGQVVRAAMVKVSLS